MGRDDKRVFIFVKPLGSLFFRGCRDGAARRGVFRSERLAEQIDVDREARFDESPSEIREGDQPPGLRGRAG